MLELTRHTLWKCVRVAIHVPQYMYLIRTTWLSNGAPPHMRTQHDTTCVHNAVQHVYATRWQHARNTSVNTVATWAATCDLQAYWAVAAIIYIKGVYCEQHWRAAVQVRPPRWLTTIWNNNHDANNSHWKTWNGLALYLASVMSHSVTAYSHLLTSVLPLMRRLL